jgi:thioredoxin-like negative regulator of GroEL
VQETGKRDASKPILIFFSSKTNGASRRAEGFLAQVLQRRRNHGTFAIKFVAQEDHPELIERFRIASTPTIVVVDEAKVRGRLIEPRGCEEIQTFLAPWLK